MADLAVAIRRGLSSAKPTDNATNTTGRLYYETDTQLLYRDNGTTWDSYSMPVPGASVTDGWYTPSGTWSYSSADAPTFVISVNADVTAQLSVGMKIKLTQTTVKYFIITAVGAFGAGVTLVTVYGGTDYTLVAAAITAPSYSMSRVPFGFPMSPTKWSVIVTDTTQRSQATPTQNTWYNLGSVTISIPIGEWRTSYKVLQQAVINGATASVDSTLSTANNSESDIEFTARSQNSAGTSTTFNAFGSVGVEKFLTVAAKTSYYLNTRTVTASVATIYNRNEIGTLVIRAVCAYL